MGEITEYVTVKDAAELLGLSKPRVDQLIKAGRIRCEAIGGIRLVLRGEVAAFKRKKRPTGRPKKGKK